MGRGPGTYKVKHARRQGRSPTGARDSVAMSPSPASRRSTSRRHASRGGSPSRERYRGHFSSTRRYGTLTNPTPRSAGRSAGRESRYSLPPAEKLTRHDRRKMARHVAVNLVRRERSHGSAGPVARRSSNTRPAGVSDNVRKTPAWDELRASARARLELSRSCIWAALLVGWAIQRARLLIPRQRRPHRIPRPAFADRATPRYAAGPRPVVL